MIKPILFNTEMVQAILSGQKTCTRRIVKDFIPEDAEWGYTAFTPKGCISCRGTFSDGYGEKFLKLPYQKGDILYVRETWCKGFWMNEKERYYYRADDNDFHCVWHPSIHMPKEAARIWLRVADVRIERLQEITEAQAEKEGFISQGLFSDDDEIKLPASYWFSKLWNFTIKKSDIYRYGWSANPWVWVIEFERCGKPKEEDE